MKDVKKSKLIHLSPSVIKTLQKIAEWEGRTVKNLIEHIVNIYATQNSKKP